MTVRTISLDADVGGENINIDVSFTAQADIEDPPIVDVEEAYPIEYYSGTLEATWTIISPEPVPDTANGHGHGKTSFYTIPVIDYHVPKNPPRISQKGPTCWASALTAFYSRDNNKSYTIKDVMKKLDDDKTTGPYQHCLPKKRRASASRNGMLRSESLDFYKKLRCLMI